MRMRATIAVLAVLLAAAMPVEAQRRELGVRQGPESVFDVPVEQVMPRLVGATPTGENGRVGGELVFWGYRLEDGSDVYFFACAMVRAVDCDKRIAAVCPNGTTVLERGENAGEIVHRRCQDVAIAAPGNLRPGCTSNTYEANLVIGLVSCR